MNDNTIHTLDNMQAIQDHLLWLEKEKLKVLAEIAGVLQIVEGEE